MNEVSLKYKQKKFFKCLELLNSLPEGEDVVQNFLNENCRLVCESVLRITESDPDKIWEIQEQHYQFFEKVVLTGLPNTNSVPLQLKLIVTFNFMFWLSIHCDKDFDDSEAEEFLKLLHKGLLSVLGRPAPSESPSNALEKVFNTLNDLKDLILAEDHKTVFLIFELIVVLIIFIVKLNRASLNKCLCIVNAFVKESKNAVGFIEPVNEFLLATPVSMCLWKFSFCGMTTEFTEGNSGVLDYLQILQSVLLYLSEDFKGSLKSLQSNLTSNVKSLWHYLVILNAYELENWGLCSGFLKKMSGLVVEKNLKARLHIMEGKLNCVNRNYKESLQQFKSALELCPHAPIIFCYIAQLYGKMGVFDLMLENFQKLVQALELGEPESNFQFNFETTLLGWIHPVDEITEVESYYALAVSYGLNEDFKNACAAFEKVLYLWGDAQPRGKKRSIELPSTPTMFHEVAVMNLMLGNLVRAEQIVLDALDQYVPQEFDEHKSRESLLCKDLEWLQRLLQYELLEADMELKELSSELLYSEDLIFIFPQNIIGLLILSEIQRMQGIEDYKTTLSTVFSFFSKYLASHNNGKVNENEKLLWTLVRALAGKTCIRIAEIQMELSDYSNCEKMFKRALSCNRGDKDALYKYYKVLLQLGRQREALKLWNTFAKEQESISVDSLQSFSLRYILRNKITTRELRKIEEEIESSKLF